MFAIKWPNTPQTQLLLLNGYLNLKLPHHSHDFIASLPCFQYISDRAAEVETNSSSTSPYSNKTSPVLAF